MKAKLHPVKFFVLGVLAMVAWKWINTAILIFSEHNFELTMSVFHFAFLIGVGLLILIAAILIIAN